ncbi:MAG: TlpA disulfide reductase family protein [Pseudomonadota bacterium]
MPRPLPLAFALAALLYAAPGAPANATDLAPLAPLATGHMDKLVVHEAPRERVEAEFIDANGTPMGLDAFAGQVVLVNFWATWCPPCRAEMPAIANLSRALGGEDFAVVALSTDFGGLDKPRAFLEEINVTDALPLYQDAKRQLARESGVMGLPVTLLLDRQGREVARLIGDAEWDSPEAKAVVRALIEATGES